MKNLYIDCIDKLNNFFIFIEKVVDAPEKTPMGRGYVYRYKNQSIEAAIVQKLARSVTGLQSMYLLNDAGFLQEQAIIQRVCDELNEDILFLSQGVILEDITDLHKRYLDAFYEEEFNDPEDAMSSNQSRAMIPRKKIRAYINRDIQTGKPYSKSLDANKTLSNVYSGYVHAASGQVMELYYGSPPSYQLMGNCSSPLYQDHVSDMLNYFYRAILSFAFSAKALTNDKLTQTIVGYAETFALASGNAEHLRENKT